MSMASTSPDSLHQLAYEGDFEAVKVKVIMNNKWTPLIIACSAGHEDVVRLLIGAGAQINACTDQGRSGLLYACSRNRDKIVKLLLDEHADINLQDKLGASPLHRAASCGHLKVLHVMFDYSNQLDLNAQDQCKNTPLHLACEDGQVEVIKMLVEAGANKFIENKEEKKPLDLAKPEVVRIVREWFE
ncbi:hypothetical protein TCAL_08837 [Tigriopus californicus]|uniref:Uncharacterized protein n=1 Tax=Tigriopus californicus TaxID=6832 RepID=A0A553PQ86_TIGCA|nr:hypothetical protein TCAL_08837 [Tigriopus californicus]